MTLNLNLYTREEALMYLLRGLEVRQLEIFEAQRMIKHRIANEVAADQTGQPHCPIHGTDYNEVSCATCQRLTGTFEPVAKRAVKLERSFTRPNKMPKKRQMSEAGRKAISRATRKRWKEFRERQLGVKLRSKRR